MIDAPVNFTDKNHEHPEVAWIANFTYIPQVATVIIAAHRVVDTEETENSPAFEEFFKLPQIYSKVRTRSLSSMTNDYTLPTGL